MMKLFRKKKTIVFLVIVITVVWFLAAKVFQNQLSEIENGDQLVRQSASSSLKRKIANYTKMFSIASNDCQLSDANAAWHLAESWITSRQVTDPTQSNKLGCILAAIRKGKVTHADTNAKGTQLKLLLTLEGGQKLVMKPKAYSRDYVMVGTPYAGKDRHNAEIAAFHLNRILGLNKAPIVAGRIVDLESELRPVAHNSLLKTYFYKNGNSCFYGKCHYCKGPETGVCATRTKMEGSLSLWFPDSFSLGSPQPHPWRRTYRANKLALWEKDENYCSTVKSNHPYDTPPRLLDLIELAIFDFLISNADRHHYETFEYGKDSIVVALDNGKSFGNPYSDEESILAPLKQCCMLRSSTYRRLYDLKDGVVGQVLFEVLELEPLSPLLTPQHYVALDRRLDMVLRAVGECIYKQDGNKDRVLVDDGYT